jgi:hypothetical protein
VADHDEETLRRRTAASVSPSYGQLTIRFGVVIGRVIALRIVVLGSGGIGGYYEVLLARRGHDVAFIARGGHLEAMQRRGLTLRTPPRNPRSPSPRGRHEDGRTRRSRPFLCEVVRYGAGSSYAAAADGCAIPRCSRSRQHRSDRHRGRLRPRPSSPMQPTWRSSSSALVRSVAPATRAGSSSASGAESLPCRPPPTSACGAPAGAAGTAHAGPARIRASSQGAGEGWERAPVASHARH